MVYEGQKKKIKKKGGMRNLTEGLCARKERERECVYGLERLKINLFNQ